MIKTIILIMTVVCSIQAFASTEISDDTQLSELRIHNDGGNVYGVSALGRNDLIEISETVYHGSKSVIFETDACTIKDSMGLTLNIFDHHSRTEEGSLYAFASYGLLPDGETLRITAMNVYNSPAYIKIDCNLALDSSEVDSITVGDIEALTENFVNFVK